MRTTFDLSHALREQLDAACRQPESRRAKKSAWICEALAALAASDPDFLLVTKGSDASLDTKAAVVLTEAACAVLRAAKRKIRERQPDVDGIYGRVIRSAIKLRLSNERITAHE